jgi:Right handed beta helix region
MSRSVAEHGIYVSNSGDRPVIRRNHVWGNSGNGIHMNADLSQGGDGLITGAVVEANVIHGNGRTGGSGINGDGVQGSRIVNNILYDNHASGISLYRIDAPRGRGTTSSRTTRSCRPPTVGGRSTSRTPAPATAW